MKKLMLGLAIAAVAVMGVIAVVNTINDPNDYNRLSRAEYWGYGVHSDLAVEISTETEKAEKPQEFEATEPSTEAFELDAPTEVTDAQTEVTDAPTEATTAFSMTYYTVNGAMLPMVLQCYAYTTLKEFGCEDYFPLFLCQMYQESRFNQESVSAYGDYGLCQIKGKYHDYYKQLAGLHDDADLIHDPCANIYVGAWIMARNIKATGDVDLAISGYYMGTFEKYSEEYVQQVRQWESTLKVVN